MSLEPKIDEIQQQILSAIDEQRPLYVFGGNTKQFLGRDIQGEALALADYTGVISYEPTELYVTAKAGTPLIELNRILAEKGQMLAFEPAEISEQTTIGGVVATGLSGPARSYAGSVRDHVLGIRCLNGMAKDLSFGGQVMKNVAGYDLSRLLTGSFGTLGVILEVTLKVAPIPEFEMTIFRSISLEKALEKMRSFFSSALPVTATHYDGENLYTRLSGNEHAVKHAAGVLEFDTFEQGKSLWCDIRDYKAAFFNDDMPLWRVSVPTTADLPLQDMQYCIDWGGAQYWIKTDRPADDMFSMANAAGGSAFLFHGETKGPNRFQPLSAELLTLHKSLKQAFDPQHILNPGKMYAEI